MDWVQFKEEMEVNAIGESLPCYRLFNVKAILICERTLTFLINKLVYIFTLMDIGCKELNSNIHWEVGCLSILGSISRYRLYLPSSNFTVYHPSLSVFSLFACQPIVAHFGVVPITQSWLDVFFNVIFSCWTLKSIFQCWHKRPSKSYFECNRNEVSDKWAMTWFFVRLRGRPCSILSAVTRIG